MESVVLFFMGRQRLVGQDVFIVNAWRLHSDTPYSVGRLWRSDQSDADNYTWQHTLSQDTDIHAPGERPQILVSDRGGHWNRLSWI